MKRGFLLIITICMIIASTGCSLLGKEEAGDAASYTFTAEADYDTISWDGVTLRVEKEYLKKADRNDAAQKVESAAQAAGQFLAEHDQHPVSLILHNGSGATMVYEDHADIYFAQNKDIPYTSFVTQIMAGVGGVPDWLREGVGAYSADINKESMLDTQGHMIECLQSLKEQQKQESESEDAVIATYFDIDTLARTLYRNAAYTNALDLGDMAEEIASIGYAQEAYNYRGAYCIYAGSFIKYLEKNYGREAVLALYDGESFKSVIGGAFDDIRAAWISSLQ